MDEIKDLVEKTINPPGILKKNRRALFLAIRDIALMVKKDALTAFNAHFPYLADSKKLQDHGAALLIPHLLHDTETEYRERVAAASFFLMKAGERQYIMGQLEERFAARYKIVEEFLNIHLKVTDLTDDERDWALELLDSLLNPNIYTELSEWFHYIDDVILADSALYSYERQDIDFFEEKILRDGRILRDGKAIFDKRIRVLRNGYFKRNGGYGRSGEYTFPGTDILRLPLDRGSGYRDVFIATVKKPLADIQLGSPPRDGTRLRDGVYPRGWHTAFETMPPFDLFNTETETLPTSDRYPAVVKKPMSDTHVNSIARDGSRPRNGMLQRANILDEPALSYTKHEADTARRRIWRDGALKRDGSEDRSGMGKESICERAGSEYTLTPLTETITVDEISRSLITNDSAEEYVNSVTRNGTYKRDGLLQRASLLDTAGMNCKTTAVKEAAQYRMFRNGMAKRDGKDSRSGFGSSGIYENGVAAVKLPVEKEIEEVQDAAFQTAYKNNSDDLFKNVRKRDGALPRGGATRRSNYIIDVCIFKYATASFQEEAEIEDGFAAGMRKHRYRNGEFLRDGSILRDSMMLLPL
ncbi:MAG: hypothetical protein LBG27_01580 [Spirochaetaceae bacterium]|jgi:hypothetical protein|nr:hypothetical protein [Spirochaetaceae bacterium]